MAKIKISDYVTRFLVEQGVRDLFLISGGGMMHLLDSAGKQEGLNLIFNLNEQATGICAETYGQYTGNLGACMVTTGPGATNAITGCAGAWTDSTPTLFISGQVRIEQMGQLKDLRIYGPQEIAIVPCVKPITKYAVCVLDKNDIKYHLKKAVYLATHGRKGPVWIDIPLDIQGAIVEEEDLRDYDPVEEQDEIIASVTEEDIKRIFELLNTAQRPAILIGYGVVSAGGRELIRELAEKLQIPVLATWRAKGVFGDEEPLFFGSPGVPTTRFSNYVVQNCDFLLIIGTRLNPVITAYDESHFAPLAKKVMVDIEKKEIDKLNISFEHSIVADAGVFLKECLSHINCYEKKNRSVWLAYCTKMKEKYPLIREKQPFDNEGKVDGFKLADVLSEHSKASDVFVASSSGRTCGITHMAYKLKRGQRFLEALGLGSMGWCLPAAIAACVASGKKRTLLIEGDGSLQHNIQELQLIQTYNLPIKVFIFENGGYASIYTMQRNNFERRFCGCNEKSGLVLPDIKNVAILYHLPYFIISNDEELEDVIGKIMSDDTPCLCSVRGSINFDEIPKSMTIANPDGTFSSSKLENLYPFVTKEDQEENMPKWKD